MPPVIMHTDPRGISITGVLAKFAMGRHPAAPAGCVDRVSTTMPQDAWICYALAGDRVSHCCRTSACRTMHKRAIDGDASTSKSQKIGPVGRVAGDAELESC